MGENKSLIRSLLVQPSQTGPVLKDKSSRLFNFLIIPSAILFGFNYSVSHFQVNVTHLVFWLLVLLVGFLSLSSIASFLGIYYAMARAGRERDSGPAIKVLAYHYLLIFLLFNLVAVGPIILLYICEQYFLSVVLYDIFHVALLLWIGGLSVQALQVLRKESELRSCLKVFAALFVSYSISALQYLLTSAVLINNVIR